MKTWRTRPLATLEAAAAAALAIVIAAPGARGEDRTIPLPEASPAAKVMQKIGLTTVEIAYHRPAVKGRKIWGGLVPWGEVWRTGANDATTISFSDPVTISGKTIPAGTYAFFAIPNEKAWTLILNGEPEQWGAYFRKTEKDVLRWDVIPEAAPKTERLVYAIDLLADDRLGVSLTWERVRIRFDVGVDVTGMMNRTIEKALADARPEDWAVYLQAARYSFDRGERLDDCLAWIDRSLQAKESFWNLELKGRILQKKSGKIDEAVPLLEKAALLAKGKAPDAYVDGLKKTIAGWKAGK